MVAVLLLVVYEGRWMGRKRVGRGSGRVSALRSFSLFSPLVFGIRVVTCNLPSGPRRLLIHPYLYRSLFAFNNALGADISFGRPL